jgi:hypothetical protein
MVRQKHEGTDIRLKLKSVANLRLKNSEMLCKPDLPLYASAQDYFNHGVAKNTKGRTSVSSSNLARIKHQIADTCMDPSPSRVKHQI